LAILKFIKKIKTRNNLGLFQIFSAFFNFSHQKIASKTEKEAKKNILTKYNRKNG